MLVWMVAAAAPLQQLQQHGVESPQSPKESAPDFALRDLRGRTVRLEAFRGRVVLINFWATWCPPCRAEMPELVRLQKEYEARGLQVIGVTQPPYARGVVRRLARRFKINYPIVYGTRETALAFGAGEVLPTTVVIDREGRVRAHILGILEQEEFAEQIEPLLR